MKLLDEYFKIQKEIYDYFGYEERWEVIPIDDCTEYYWYIDSYDTEVIFIESINNLKNDFNNGNYYSNEIIQNGSNSIYITDDYTMIVVDTNTDDNCFLSIFDNAKKINNPNDDDSDENIENIFD